MTDYQAKLPDEAQAPQRLAEVGGLSTMLHKSAGDASAAKSQTVADSAQIDLLDGKLYVFIRELNRAARRAIRNGCLKAQLSEYVFHHLKRASKKPVEEPVPPPAPPENPPPAANA